VVYWSEFLTTDPEVRIRFPALPDFLRRSGCGIIFNQAREAGYFETSNAAVT
jgi:hypothetical protein